MRRVRWTTEDDIESVSHLMLQIGKGVGMKYGCEGSSAFSKDAVSYLEKLGYKVRIRESAYNQNKALEMLDNGCPIIMRGCGRSKMKGALFWKKTTFSECHAWVMDGLMIRFYKCQHYKVNRETWEMTSTYTYPSEVYFHNNWGWSGNGNGYFAAGCFDLRKGEYDEDDYENNNNYQYNNYMYVVSH